MLKRHTVIILLICLFSNLASFQAFAQVDSALSISLPCHSQSEAERNLLFKQGLAQILVRVSADPAITSHDSVLKANTHILDYVEQFGYDGGELTITYYQDMLTELLQQIGTPTFMLQRPQVIAWLALEGAAERHLVSAESDPKMFTHIKQAAKQYDVPLMLPLLDLEDVSSVTVTDVWGQFTDVLSRASQRYGAPVMLVGRLRQLPDTALAQGEKAYQGDWTLHTTNQVSTWQTSVSNLSELWPEVMQKVAKHLYDNYAVPTNSLGLPGNPLLIGIQGITTRSDFQQASYYLKQLQGVQHVSLKQISDKCAVFEVVTHVSEGKSQLAQRLNHDQRMVVPALPQEALASADLIYEWEP